MTPERRRDLDALAVAIGSPRPCFILQALHIGGAITGASVTQAELDELAAEVLGPAQEGDTT